MEKLIPTDLTPEKAMRLPLGAASPLWFAFMGAASAGAAWYWMTRWTKATNLEAFVVAPEAVEEIVEEVEAAAEEVSEPVVEAVQEVLVAVTPEPVAVLEPVIDDLTVLVGIGPKLAIALADRGVTSYAQIAAWTEEDLAEVDAALSLKGRAVRDAWVAQAKRLGA